MSNASTRASKKVTKPQGRSLANPVLIEGTILIGNTITFSAIYPHLPHRTTYRGTVIDIRTWGDGCDYASIAVLALPEMLALPLEPLAAP